MGTWREDVETVRDAVREISIDAGHRNKGRRRLAEELECKLDRILAAHREPVGETPTCATCQHFRKGTDRAHARRISDLFDQCCHPSEAHPLHWQEVPDTFSCNQHAPAATRGEETSR